MTHICHWCHQRAGIHQHHVVPRSVAPDRKQDPTNIIWLCLVCHAAAHRQLLYDHDFSCLVCPFIQHCAAGQALLPAFIHAKDTVSLEALG